MGNRHPMSALEVVMNRKTRKKICYHLLEEINEPPYRYRCTKCNQKLREPRGIVIKKQKNA